MKFLQYLIPLIILLFICTITICLVDYFTDGCIVDYSTIVGYPQKNGTTIYQHGEICHQMLIHTKAGKERQNE